MTILKTSDTTIGADVAGDVVTKHCVFISTDAIPELTLFCRPFLLPSSQTVSTTQAIAYFKTPRFYDALGVPSPFSKHSSTQQMFLSYSSDVPPNVLLLCLLNFSFINHYNFQN